MTYRNDFEAALDHVDSLKADLKQQKEETNELKEQLKLEKQTKSKSITYMIDFGKRGFGIFCGICALIMIIVIICAPIYAHFAHKGNYPQSPRQVTGTYLLKNRHTDSCLAVNNDYVVVPVDCSYSSLPMQWEIEATQRHLYFRLKNKISGEYVTVVPKKSFAYTTKEKNSDYQLLMFSGTYVGEWHWQLPWQRTTWWQISSFSDLILTQQGQAVTTTHEIQNQEALRSAQWLMIPTD